MAQSDNIPAMLQSGEYVVRKEAVDMIGAPILERINDMPEKGGHSSIDRLIKMATMSNEQLRIFEAEKAANDAIQQSLLAQQTTLQRIGNEKISVGK